MPRRPAAVTLTSVTGPPQQRRKASSDVIDSLRDMIASGELDRGARLPAESELASHFGVSQPTVREALRALEAMGLIEVRHGSGAYVTGDSRQFIANSMHNLLQVDRVGILDVVEMRLALAPYSAASVVTRASAAELDAIEEQNQRLEEAAQVAHSNAIAAAAVAFQLSISAASHKPLLFAIESVLAELLVRLQSDAFAKRSTAFRRKWSREFAGDRRTLVEAFRARDEDGAMAAMTVYLEHQRTRFGSDRALSQLRVSDPEVLSVIKALT